MTRRGRGRMPSALLAAAITIAIAPAARADERLALLDAAESAMARGDSAKAVLSLERAALMLHSADTEMALVRAWLEAGEYRRALAFAAHTAGAHRDTPSAAALYAWLLAVGGQQPYAQRLLREAQAKAPDDAVLAEAARRLQSPGATTTALLLGTPHRMAPHATGLDAPLPASAWVTGSGVLLPDGRHALLPASAVSDAAGLWVRDGLGHTTAVRVERRLDDLQLVLARLDTEWDGSATQPAGRDPFAGSAGFVVAYAAGTDATPAWPWLYAGFVGSAPAAAGAARPLGIDVPGAVPGAPLFDASGRWSGLALAGTNGAPQLVAIERLRERLPDLVTRPVEDGAASVRPMADVVYERSLRVALQVIAARLPH